MECFQSGGRGGGGGVVSLDQTDACLVLLFDVWRTRQFWRMFNLISFFNFQIIKIVCLVLKGGAFFKRERGAGHIVENQNSPWRPFRQGNSQLVDTQSYIRGTSPLYRTAKMKSQNKTKIKFNRIIITENGWDFAFLACCSLELDPSQEMFKCSSQRHIFVSVILWITRIIYRHQTIFFS